MIALVKFDAKITESASVLRVQTVVGYRRTQYVCQAAVATHRTDAENMSESPFL